MSCEVPVTELTRRIVRMAVVTSLALSVVPFSAFANDAEREGDALSTGAAVEAPLEGTARATADSAAAEPTSSALPTVTPEPLPKFRLQDDDLRVGFHGTWSSVWAKGSSGQSHRISRKSGSYVLASFEGTSVALLSRRGPARGRARIYLDGVSKGTIDLYARSTGTRTYVWRSGKLSRGVHTVKVVVLGSKSSASSASYVPIDAFDIVGSPRSKSIGGTVVNNGSSKLAKRGSWWVAEQSAAYGDSAWRTRQRGATVTLRFKGTRFAWVGRKDSGLGKAEVLIDGKKVATVSQYASERSARRVAYATSGLTNGTHNVTIRALASPSTGSGRRVDVDAFVCNGTLLKAYPATPFHYPWVTYIVVDKSSFKLHWVKNGVLIKSYPIAHGKTSTPTPSRVWRIDSKYYTDPSSVYGPRKMRMYRRVSTSRGYAYEYTGYAIHGTNEPWVIGTKASHGCIRMYNRDVLELFPQVPLHTMVVTRY